MLVLKLYEEKVIIIKKKVVHDKGLNRFKAKSSFANLTQKPLLIKQKPINNLKEIRIKDLNKLKKEHENLCRR